MTKEEFKKLDELFYKAKSNLEGQKTLQDELFKLKEIQLKISQNLVSDRRSISARLDVNGYHDFRTRDIVISDSIFNQIIQEQIDDVESKINELELEFKTF